tara:strand:+ start:606 stop:785 length:180 start_codon:yes stop_codon:yes gene_type:complete
MAGRTYKSKYQGQGGIFRAGSRSGQTYHGSSTSKNKFGHARYADGLFKKAKALYKSITN